MRMLILQFQNTERAPRSLCSRGESEVSRLANLRLNWESPGADPGAKAASLRRVSSLSVGKMQPARQFLEKCSLSVDLMDELGQLIKRVNSFEAHENKRRVHQIKIEMHQRLETKSF